MADIKVTRDCYIPKENIKFYVSYNTNSVILDVRKKKKEGLVYDYTHGKRIGTVVYLHTGDVILTAFSIETLHQRKEGTEDG